MADNENILGGVAYGNKVVIMEYGNNGDQINEKNKADLVGVVNNGQTEHLVEGSDKVICGIRWQDIIRILFWSEKCKLEI